ncbi:hypothetical protein HK405_014521, partial [Cladochytrium tenue]
MPLQLAPAGVRKRQQADTPPPGTPTAGPGGAGEPSSQVESMVRLLAAQERAVADLRELVSSLQKKTPRDHASADASTPSSATTSRPAAVNASVGASGGGSASAVQQLAALRADLVAVFGHLRLSGGLVPDESRIDEYVSAVRAVLEASASSGSGG